MCRPFLYTVLVVSIFSQPQLTTKNEIGNPFGKVYLFFLLGLFCNRPLFLLILRDFYKPSSGSRKSIFILLLQSSLPRIDIAVRNRCIEICFWSTLFNDLT